MSEVIQVGIALLVYFLLDRYLKPYPMRKWLGVVLMLIGVAVFAFSDKGQWFGIDLASLPIITLCIGSGLFVKRRRFEEGG